MRQPPRAASARRARRSTAATPGSSSSAGLRGGKGVPESVAEHPLVFATFTGAELRAGAHDPRGGGKQLRVPAAQPRRDVPARPLARLRRSATPRTTRAWARRSARTASTTSAARCGTSTRAGCSSARETYVERELARQAGLTQKAARELVRVLLRQGGRVPAPRRRALPHCSGASTASTSDELVPPPAEFDAQLLADAITAALPKATVPAEDDARGPVRVGRASTRSARSTSGPTRGRPRAWPATSPSTRPSPPRTPAASATGSSTTHELGRPALPRARPAADHRAPGTRASSEDVDDQADAPVGAPVRLRRALLHQEPPLLDHVQGAARGACRARRRSRTGASEASAKSDHNLIHVATWRYAGSGYPKSRRRVAGDLEARRAREAPTIGDREAGRTDEHREVAVMARSRAAPGSRCGDRGRRGRATAAGRAAGAVPGRRRLHPRSPIGG